MKTSTKRLIMSCVGFALIVGYFVYEDTPIFELEWHQIFMIGVIGFFTALNFARFIIENRIEYYKKYGENYEGR